MVPSIRNANPRELSLKLKTEIEAVLSPPLMEYLVVLDVKTTEGGMNAVRVKTSRNGTWAVDSTVTKWGP
jgi:hypothetical protein